MKTQPKAEPVVEVDPVEAWRAKLALDLGYPAKMALWISERQEIDVHTLGSLIGRGATKAQALRILSPL